MSIKSSEYNSEMGNMDFTRIPMVNLCPGVVTNFNLYLKSKDDKYVLYRNADTTITDDHIQALRNNNVEFLHIAKDDRAVYVRYMEDNLLTILSASMSMTENASLVYESANQLLKDVLVDPGSGENIERVDKLIDTTISQVIFDEDNLVNMLDVMAFDYSTYTHSVNVSILGLALGHRLGFSQKELSSLGAGLLLHDVGKSQISPSILFKTGPLDEMEWQEIKKHPEMGRELLKPSGRVKNLSMGVVVQHHEKCNGAGYPYGLTEAQIHPFAKISSIVDVFDALTTQRVYKSAVNSFPAIQTMMDEMKGSFCSEYLSKFILMLSWADKNDVRVSDENKRNRGDKAA